MFDEPGCASVLAVGQSLPFRRGGSVSLPLDVSRTLEDLLDRAELDFVHVHEPFAPSASSAALRHSRALNVGTFHSTTERVRLDAGGAQGRRAAVRPARRPHGELRRDARPDRALLPRRLPGDPARAPTCSSARRADDGTARDRLLRRGGARRAAAVPARAAPAADRRSTGARRSGCATRPRRRPCRCHGGCASGCARRPGRRLRGPAPGARRRSRWPPRPAPRRRRSSCCARSPAAPCRWSRACPSTRRRCATASSGLLFEPRDAVTLAAQLERLIAEPAAGRATSATASTRRTARARVVAGGRAVRGAVRGDRGAPPRQRAARRPAAARRARLHPRRPAHAHRPLAGLRDAGRRRCSRPPRASAWARSR